MKFLFLFLFFQSSLTFAQEAVSTTSASPTPESSAATEAQPLALSEEKFSAIVQYAQGKQEYDFKDLIQFDKTIEVPQKSYLKVITQKRCVAVFYENSKIQTPKDKVSPWIISSGSARWICPEDKIERVVYKNSELQVQNGEFLINGSSLNILRNNVKYNNENLKLKTAYIYKKGEWVEKEEQPEPYELWEKQKKFAAPIESSFHKMEIPDDPNITRVFLNVAPLGISGYHHHERKEKFSGYDIESHFFRLGTNFLWKNKSVISFLEYVESDGDHQGSGGIPVGEESYRLKIATLALGVRNNHVKSSSYYYYTGLARQEIQFDLHPNPADFYHGRVVYPWNLSVGAGYQKIFWAKNWISLMVGLDFKITQSLSKGDVTSYYHPFAIDNDINGFITSYSGHFYLGPVFNF